VMDGYETTLLLKKQFPAIKIIVLSQFDSAELINHYLKAGVHAYLLKNDDGIESAITAVMNGKVYISNSISAHVHVEASNRPIKFTDKEILILKCLTGGESNTLIAQNLGVSKNSIETYRKRMLKKFQANSITELINYAHKIGAL
ncbi:MAG TPA: response regulator transcription factor, partial [Cyclobacteriaceae bacterium]|nr:response regulator transcription factor [Cyclobacteriaceae bacterium]